MQDTTLPFTILGMIQKIGDRKQGHREIVNTKSQIRE